MTSNDPKTEPDEPLCAERGCRRRHARFRVAHLLAVLGWLVAAAGCTPPPSDQLVQTAEFGVFYGGQIQRRKELPFQLDGAKQRQGFRVEFTRPLPRDSVLQWELSRPGPKARNGLSDPRKRTTQLRSAKVRKGQKRSEQFISFRAGDPLGMWNLRVTLDDQLILDQPFTVYDKAKRRAARKRAHQDAGL